MVCVMVVVYLVSYTIMPTVHGLYAMECMIPKDIPVRIKAMY